MNSDDSLESLYPQIAAEWNYGRNQVHPSDVKPYSNLKRWWICPHGHEYETVVARRTTQGTGCSYCSGKKIGYGNDLLTKFPEVASQWNYGRNRDLKPELVTAATNRKVWWRCDVGHEWEGSIANRTRNGRGCPYCSNQRVGYGNDFASCYPTIAAEWNHPRNAPLTPTDVTKGSRRRVWWICRECRREWQAAVSARTGSGTGCPSCADTQRGMTKRQPTSGYSLADRYPHIAIEWHPHRNGPLSPSEINPGTPDKAWWRCASNPDHQWKASVAHRAIRGQGCPYCSGRLASAKNNLAVNAPEMAREWHPTKNGRLTPYDIPRESGKRVWWQCKVNPCHEWQATPNNRSRAQGCPFCSIPKVSQIEIRIFVELRLVLRPFVQIVEHNPRIRTGVDKLLSVDMLFDRVVVEYDGVYWHRPHAVRDKDKTKQLVSAGYRVLRVRERGLRVISDADILVRSRQDAHVTAAAVLLQLLRLEWLPSESRDSIESYVAANKAVGREEADRMISDLLVLKVGKR